MNKTQKKRTRVIITLISILYLIASCFMYTTTQKFLKISEEINTQQTIAAFVNQQPQQIEEEIPIIITEPQEVIVKEELPVVVAARQDIKPMSAISRGGSPEETINAHVKTISSKYENIKPELIMSIIYHESRYNPNAKNGNCVGLMQVSTYWHADRAKNLGVTNFYDPYSNVLVGIDYISELLTQYKDPALVLMLYNMNHDDAIKLYREGKITSYAKSVLSKAEEFKKGV